jgi:hypothetical protein
MMKRRLQISALLAASSIVAWPALSFAQGPGGGGIEKPESEAPPVPRADDAQAGEEKRDAEEDRKTEGEQPAAEPTSEASAPVETKAEAQAVVAAPAAPKASGDQLSHPGYLPGYKGYAGAGMSPYIPRVGSLPGGMTPSFGSSAPPDDWSFNFTGFMSASVRASMNSRPTPRDGQSGTVIHTAPQTVEVYNSFNDTQSTPGNWVGLLFSYGNRYVTANVSFDTHNPSRAAAYEVIGSQYFLNDTFLSLRVPPVGKLRLAWNVGAFSQPYGYLGEYGGGLYTPPLIGRVSGVGETLNAEYDLDDQLMLVVEDGFHGGNRTGKVPEGVLNTGSTNFSDSNLPPSWVHDAHIAIRRKGETTLQLMAHFITNWSMSDQVAPEPRDNPDTRQWDERYPKDGRIHVLGIDAKARSRTYGYLAFGAAFIDAKNAYRLRGLSTYAGDGVSLTNDWLGATTGGTGKIWVAAANYKISVGSLMRAPEPFWGDGPDLVVEVGAQVAGTKSEDPGFDGRLKNKFGADVLYTFVPWLGVGLRADRIAPNSKDPEETFYAIAPRLQFRSNWQSHETVTLKYSKWFYGKHTHSDSWDARPQEQLDDHMLALSFGMWW